MDLAVTFLDQTLPAATASVLHTAGAIGYLGGMGAYLGWRQALRGGTHQRALLLAGVGVTYLSILANLLGGFMRTYQTGHPSFTEFFVEPWAAIMVLKHGALFAGMFGAAYLFEIVTPRLVAAHEAGTTLPSVRFAGPAAALVIVSILVASIMGVAASMVTIDGMGDMVMDDEGTGTPTTTFTTQTWNFEGQASSTAPAVGQFDVAAGAVQVQAYLAAGTAFVTAPVGFTLTMSDPDGRQTSASSDPVGTFDAAAPDYNTDVQVKAPVAAVGTWTYSVASQAAAAADWQLTVTVTGPDGLVLEDTITISSGFYEINTIMETGADLHWDWSTADGSDAAFNIHQHVNGQTVYAINDEFASHNGTYTSAEDGGVSLMWEPVGSGPVTITYRVWGDYTLHSIYD